MPTFQKVKIKDVGRVVTGKTPPTTKKEFFDGNFPFITPSDIPDYIVRRSNVAERTLSDAWKNKAKNYTLPKNTICYVCIGSTIGKSCLTDEISFSNQQINSIICDTNISYPFFLFYLLKDKFAEIKSIAKSSGSAKGIINKTTFENLELSMPDLPTQTRIASVLSAYDDLIENNEKRIKALEEMAQLLYVEWFVRFNLPAEVLTEAGFPDGKLRIVDSGTEYGMIPAGWEVKKLNDILLKIESGSRPKGGIDSAERGVPSIGAENINGLGQYDFSKEKFVSEEFFRKMRHGHIQNRDVLLYKDGAHIGRKTMFGDDFPHKRCSINEHVFILRTNNYCSQAFIYFWLDQPTMTQAIRNLNSNAAQPGINQEGVKGLPIILQQKGTLDIFDEKIDSILSLIFNLAKENNKLSKTRDLLIPQLVTGKRALSN